MKTIKELNDYSLEHNVSIIVHKGKLCGMKAEYWR